MNKHSSAKSAHIKQLLIAGLAVAMLAVGASAQIRIGNITIPTKEPKKPPTTNSNTTPPNPNGNKTPTTPNANTRPTTNTNTRPTTNPRVETGPTREQVDAFRKDMEPYKQGMKHLMYMAKHNWDCSDAKDIRSGLTEGAAFLEIIKQKYPGIENPSWAKDPEDLPYNLAGNLRRYAENREEIAKNCVNQLLGAKVAEKIKSIESTIAEFDKPGEWSGYVLGGDSFDKAARHAALMEKYKEHYALVGLTMPDGSVFAEYDAAHDRLVALANENAGKWVFPPTFHDAMIEAKARGWLKDRHPKSTVVKIGMLHGEWQVNHQRNGIPSGRYKRGYVMFRMPGFQNCLVTSFALEQNYIGGGRFNAEAITSGLQHSLRVQLCK